MGTKYYGVIVLPVFLILELTRKLSCRFEWRAFFARSAVFVGVFVLAFFLVKILEET